MTFVYKKESLVFLGGLGCLLQSMTVCALPTSCSFSNPQVLEYVNQKNYSQAIEQQLVYLKESGQHQTGLNLMELAVLYWKDQQQELAFETYLKALDSCSQLEARVPSQDESRLYQEALTMYLTGQSGNLSDIAIRVLDTIQPIVVQHPEYQYLSLLAATSLANLNRFEEFFPIFYESYQIYPESYLAKKTKAILKVKVLEREASRENRQRLKGEAIQLLLSAADQYPQDPALYKLSIVLSIGEGSMRNVFTQAMQRIIEHNVKIPRQDIDFYVSKAITYKEYQMADKFLQQCRSWYAYSRTIEDAQRMLDSAQHQRD